MEDTPTVDESHARLIAAAPDMLEALKWARTYILGRLPDHNTMTTEEIEKYLVELENKVTGAILLATGKRPE